MCIAVFQTFGSAAFSSVRIVGAPESTLLIPTVGLRERPANAAVHRRMLPVVQLHHLPVLVSFHPSSPEKKFLSSSEMCNTAKLEDLREGQTVQRKSITCFGKVRVVSHPHSGDELC